MFDTNHPILLFFTNDKIDLPISFDDCRFGFDDECSFEDVPTSYPLAFCVGCSAAEQTALANRLAKLGMSVLQNSQPGEQTAVIAHKGVFIDRSGKSIGFSPRKKNQARLTVLRLKTARR